MKALYLLLLLLFFVPDVEAQDNYSICQSELDKGEICRMLTPTLTCTDYNYTCFFKNGSTAQQGNLTTLADNIYYFNFTQTTATGYICELCDSSTREITVVEDSFFFFLFFILAWIMFAMFLWQQNQFLIFLSGAFFIVLGMFTLIYGFGNLNNWLTQSIAYIHLGIGLMVLLTAGIRFVGDL